MNAAYIVRLLCLSLASFFLIHLFAGLLVHLVSPMAVRFAESMRPRSAARLLLILRLFPPVVSLAVVGGFCVPSYLWLEPATATEDIGTWCIGAALLGLACWIISVTRAVRALVGSFCYIRHCGRVARKKADVWIVDDATPVLGLGGIIRHQLVVSPAVINALSKDELAVALRHERAHGASRDNLKRLLILLSPSVLPFAPGFKTLERGWTKFTEWAADDGAAGGDTRRSVALAAALVHVARMNSAAQSSPWVASLLADGRDLSARVDRLLCLAAMESELEPRISIFAGGATLILAISGIAFAVEPATFHSVYALLEHLVR
jgi:Zn-dependent protease with chaperone function